MLPDNGAAPWLRLPEPAKLLDRRLSRLRHLAHGHPLADYLNLVAQLTETQQVILLDMPVVDHCHVEQNEYPAVWREVFSRLVLHMDQQPSSVQKVLDQLKSLDALKLDHIAHQLLSGQGDTLNRSEVPFIAAALQTVWMKMASQAQVEQFDKQEEVFYCPVCGAHPVAGVLTTGAGVLGLRYLVCSLCSSEWNVTRIQCVGCHSNREVAYYSQEAENVAIKAEACDACTGYLKLFDFEKNNLQDVVADDLATVPLDVLMAEAGYSRLGFNLLLMPGDELESTASLTG